GHLACLLGSGANGTWPSMAGLGPCWQAMSWGCLRRAVLTRGNAPGPTGGCRSRDVPPWATDARPSGGRRAAGYGGRVVGAQHVEPRVHGCSSTGSTHTRTCRRASVHASPRSPAATAVRCEDRKSTRLNSSHVKISYAVFCLKKKTTI